ncbi:MAG: acyltransferase [Candidatus Thorarchaeota archaeon]
MRKLNISQVCTFFANGSYPIEFLLFFPNRIDTKKLRQSLRKIARVFWPAFGTYTNGIITEQKYIEAEIYDETDVPEDFDPSIAQEELYYRFGPLISKSISRLFYLKVIHYNNGTVLITKMNHLVGDGYSYFYMLSVLAAVTKRTGVPLIPAILCSISKPKIYSKLHEGFLFLEKPPERNTNYDDLVVEVMEVGQVETREQAKIASEKSNLNVSTNDILCAQLLKLILKSKKQKSSKNLTLVIPVDMRKAVPELGQRFFGDGLILHRVTFTTDDVSQKSVEDLAIKIKDEFPERTSQNYLEFLTTIENWIATKNMQKLQLYDSEKEFLVTNLSRMPITRLDFGSGLPKLIVPLTRGKSGAAILTQNDKFILQLGR